MTSHVSKWRKSACLTWEPNCKRLGSEKKSMPKWHQSSFNLYFPPRVLHIWDCRSAVWPLWALMRCCVCTAPAMHGMLDHQMERGMGLAQCTAAACFSLETEASFHSASSSYTIIIAKRQSFWLWIFIPNWHQFQSCSDSALLSNVCFKRDSQMCSLSVM